MASANNAVLNIHVQDLFGHLLLILQGIVPGVELRSRILNKEALYCKCFKGGQEELGLRKGFLVLVTRNHLAVFNRVKKGAAITLQSCCTVGLEVGGGCGCG